MNKNKKIKKYKLIDDTFDEKDYLKDCPNYEYIPSFLPPVKRIIAMGDIHGDLDIAINLFKLAGLIDDNYNWIANPLDTNVIQVGDQIDSCRPYSGYTNCHTNYIPGDKQEDISVMDFFDMMHQKASKVGGKVYSLLGNHEIMNAQNIFDYVSYNNYQNFHYIDNNGIKYDGPSGRLNAFKQGGPIASMMACKRPSILVIGSNMFVHAGILPALVKILDELNLDNKSKIKYLNGIMRKWLLHKLKENDKYADIVLSGDVDNISPFWIRIYGQIPPNEPIDSPLCYNYLKKVLKTFKIGQMVIGHTPQIFTNNYGINGTCYEKKQNKLYRIDGGFSRAFNNMKSSDTIQALEILDDSKFNILSQTIDRNYKKPIKLNH